MWALGTAEEHQDLWRGLSDARWTCVRDYIHVREIWRTPHLLALAAAGEAGLA